MCFPVTFSVKEVHGNRLFLDGGRIALAATARQKYRKGDLVEVLGQIVVQKVKKQPTRKDLA
jgi:hypothetical protein